jgi:hypothetical protein
LTTSRTRATTIGMVGNSIPLPTRSRMPFSSILSPSLKGWVDGPRVGPCQRLGRSHNRVKSGGQGRWSTHRLIRRRRVMDLPSSRGVQAQGRRQRESAAEDGQDQVVQGRDGEQGRHEQGKSPHETPPVNAPVPHLVRLVHWSTLAAEDHDSRFLLYDKIQFPGCKFRFLRAGNPDSEAG